ncbi:MAG: pyruvate ferredoxin oxidoreductase [Chloroflexi bacterium]|nr:pyruvate ferredoxin oxidoreductase [Chloroflexota bacterium]
MPIQTKVERRVSAVTGNQALSRAVRQIDPDVAAVYPITPQTDVAEGLATFVADGMINTVLVPVESEHSAMSACIGAAAAGARAFTATSSQGLAYMFEVLYVAAGLRLPIVMANVNRSLSAPINIHCDHSDSFGARDSGWVQLYSENAQQAYDNLIQAVRIAEHSKVLLPVMVNVDGFIVSHAAESAVLLDDEEVRQFIGEYTPRFSLLDVDHPITVGPFDGLHGYFFEFKAAQVEAMANAKQVILDVGKEYGALSGRTYGFFEEYGLDDADTAIVVVGSAAATCSSVVDEMRAQGMPVGLLKLRSFRPFPAEELADALKYVKAVGVLDRAVSPGLAGGPLFAEVKSALFDADARPKVASFVYGLGGREFRPEHAREAFASLFEIKKTGYVNDLVSYLGIRKG